MNKDKNSHVGISFCDLLAVAFIVLKLAGFINWSWWLVLAPLWIPLVIVIAAVLIKFTAK